jgi:hypothetical protein
LVTVLSSAPGGVGAATDDRIRPVSTSATSDGRPGRLTPSDCRALPSAPRRSQRAQLRHVRALPVSSIRRRPRARSRCGSGQFGSPASGRNYYIPAGQKLEAPISSRLGGRERALGRQLDRERRSRQMAKAIARVRRAFRAIRGSRRAGRDACLVAEAGLDGCAARAAVSSLLRCPGPAVGVQAVRIERRERRMTRSACEDRPLRCRGHR